MKAGKAYITSLGTTGLLVASSVLLLVVVGALVAFDGWPASEASSPPETVAIGEGDTERVVAKRRLARERRALERRRDRARAARARGSRARGRGGPSSKSDGDRVISDLPAPDSRPPTTATQVPAGGGSGGGDGGGTKPDDDVGGGAVGQVGDTVSTVNPQAGGTIGQTGDALGETIEQVVPQAPSVTTVPLP